MKVQGDRFNYFLDNESKTVNEIESLIDGKMTVSVNGFDIFYFSPKKEGKLMENWCEPNQKELLIKLAKEISDKKEDKKIWHPLNNGSGLVRYMSEQEVIKDLNKPINSTKTGVKETEGKLDYSEINFKLLDLMAARFMDNKHKYAKGNTLNKINKEDILWAAFRHIRKMIKPIENDLETYEDHLSAVATNMSIILDQLEIENKK